MKCIFKKLIFVLAVIILGIAYPTTVSAKIISQDDLKVRLELEQRGDATNQFEGNVKITNIGIREIEGITSNINLPEGVKLIEGSEISKDIGTLEAGESFTFKFYCEVEDEMLPDDGEGDGEIGDGEIADDSNDEDNKEDLPSIDINTGVNKPSNDKTESIIDKIQTGDSNIIIILSTIIVICIALIILLSITKNKNIKKLLSIFICITMITSILDGAIAVQAVENSKKQLKVKESLAIDKYTCEVELNVNYNMKIQEVIPSGEQLTRGEWISRLVNILELKEQQEIDRDSIDDVEVDAEIDIEEFRYPFDDIEGNQYEEDIMYGYVNSLLDCEDGNFRPEDSATREFAALTAIKALGFDTIENSLIYDDVNQVTYKNEVGLALLLGLINLEGNNFYPSRTLTDSEAEYIIDGIKGVLKSEEVEDDYDNVIKYKDDVIKLDDEIKYEVDGTIISFEINEIVKVLEVGDIIVLPTEVPYKITNVTVEEDKVIIQTEEPEIEETLEYIDIQGNAYVDASRFIPAEGIEVIESPEQRINIDEEGSLSRPGTVDLNINKKIGNFKLEGKLAFNVPEVSYKADIDVGLLDVDVNNAFLKVKFDSKLTGKISIKSDDDEDNEYIDGAFDLGKIPVVGIPGVGIYIEVKMEYTVEGKLSIVFTAGGEIGAQVLNNNLRAIKTLNSGFDMAELEASVKIGPKISGLLQVCNTWDLLDFSAGIGVSIAGSIMYRPSLVCLDATGFIYANLSALDTALIGKWLSIGYTWNIWTKKNSPKKVSLHFENLNYVPQCTYGEGTLIGTVSEASDRTKFIKNALIQVYNKSNNRLVAEATSDANGKYKIDLKAGTYVIKISKVGYITFKTTETFTPGEEKVVETFLLVGQGTAGEYGTAGGKITNALTGGSISDVEMNIRQGWNNVTGDIITTTTTDSLGKYEVSLPLGNYTIQMNKEGYLSKHINIYVVSGEALNQNNTLVPESSEMPSGDLRIVLTWGENPRDLDSHLIGPNKDNSGLFHIYFSNKTYYDDGIMYADLDLDDTSSYGPETTTVYTMNSTGKYSFYVHDYTNRYNNNSYAMSNSGAKVDVYKGDTLYVSYNIPTNTQGTYWHVFDYDADLNSIVPVNEFVYGIGYRSLKIPEVYNSIWEIEEKQAS